MRLAVVGASGRMGRAVIRAAVPDGIVLACAVGTGDVGADAGELAGVGRLGVRVTSAVSELASARADVVIDFSSPSATLAMAPIAAAARTAIVSGTTGLGDEAKRALNDASASVAVLAEPNMSLGVHVLADVVARAVAALPDWDIEIVETHHRAKADAPSGTALRLAQVARDARPTPTRLVHGREGKPGARANDEIGMHALRGGDVVGDHVVHLVAAGERIEIGHRASSRDIFAIGALRAARWIAGRAPGVYGLKDVLGG